MSAITVIVVPTWAVWVFLAFLAVGAVQDVWKIILLRRNRK